MLSVSASFYILKYVLDLAGVFKDAQIHMHTSPATWCGLNGPRRGDWGHGVNHSIKTVHADAVG